MRILLICVAVGPVLLAAALHLFATPWRGSKANMSHELRTPLNAIIGYNELLLEDAEAEGFDALVDDVRKISGSGKHLLHLINDILDLSKIEAGHMDIVTEEFDLEDLIDEVLATTQTLMANKGNRLTLDVEEGLGTMVSDATKVRQCLLNLLSNAAKFTEKGVVEFSARRVPMANGDGVRLTVTDSGIGMSEDHLGRVFEVFLQADASTTGRFGGTGLGLPIKRLCQLLGGDIEVSSVLSEGSVFTILLPTGVTSPVNETHESE